MKYQKEILENLSENILSIKDERIQNLEWKITDSNEQSFELESNENDTIKFTLHKHNSAFANIYMDIYFSKNKCTALGPDEDPFFNEDNISYSDDIKFDSFTLDIRNNEILCPTRKIIEGIYDKIKAYEENSNLKIYYRDECRFGYKVKEIQESIEYIKNVIKNDVKDEINGLSLAFNIDDLENFINLVCISMPLNKVAEFIYTLDRNFLDLTPGYLYEEFLNLSWSGGFEIKDKIISKCISNTI